MYSLTVSRPARVRAMANALAVGVLLVSAIYVFEGGLPRLSAYSASELAQLACFTLMLAGLVVGLFWGLAGSVLTLAAFAAFWAVHFGATGGMRLGGAYAMFPIAAALQFASWWLARHDGDRR